MKYSRQNSEGCLTRILGGVRFAPTGEVGYDNPCTGIHPNHQINYKLDRDVGEVSCRKPTFDTFGDHFINS